MLLDGGILSLCRPIRANSLLNSLQDKNPARSFSCSIWYLVTETLTRNPPEMHVSIWWQKKCICLQTQNKALTRTQTFGSTLWRLAQEAHCAAPMEVLTVSRGILAPSQKWVNWGLLPFLSFYSVLRSLLHGNLTLFPRNKSAEALPTALLKGMRQVNVGPITLQHDDR